MIEKATAAAGAMCVIDWKRTGARPIASRWRRPSVAPGCASVLTCSLHKSSRHRVVGRGDLTPKNVNTPRPGRRQVAPWPPTDNGPVARAPEVLGRRALNRALLARQMLLRPVKLSAAAAIERLVGMQAQAPNLPYVGLWTRLLGFRHEELSELVRSRRAVRTSLMRNTIHLVTTEDALRLKPLFQPLHERGFFRGSPWGRDLKSMNPGALLEAGREIMGERPRTIAELARLLAPRFPDRDAQSLAYGVRYLPGSAGRRAGEPDDGGGVARPPHRPLQLDRRACPALPRGLRPRIAGGHARLVGPGDAPGLRAA